MGAVYESLLAAGFFERVDKAAQLFFLRSNRMYLEQGGLFFVCLFAIPTGR